MEAQIEALRGLAKIMISHRDDVADHDRRRAGGPARRADPLQRRRLW
jgi:hypothetical protein